MGTDNERSLIERLTEMGSHSLDWLISAIPRLILAVLLIVLAVVVAGLVKRGLASVLRRLKIDAAMERVGLDKAGKRLGLSEFATLIPRVVHGLLLFVFVGIGAEAVGLDSVAHAIGNVLDYLPNVLAALLLILFGSWAAQAVGQMVERGAQESGLDFGPALGRLVAAAIIFVFAMSAINQLRIDTEIVRIVTICGLSGLALAFGLSMGLGSRRITQNILAGFYARKLFQAGDTIEVRGKTGILRGIAAIQTVVELPDQLIVFANTVFLDEVIGQSFDGQDAHSEPGPASR